MSLISSHSYESNRSADHGNNMTIEVAHMVINLQGVVTESTGDFENNKFAVETLIAIVKDIRLHAVMKLTKDNFRGLTIQFSDHYFRIRITSEEAVVFKYKLHSNLQHSSSVIA